MGRKGYAWAISAGSNASFAAIAAKSISSPVIPADFPCPSSGCSSWLDKSSLFRLGGEVRVRRVVQCGDFTSEALGDLSSLLATSTNFATNFLVSGFAGSVPFSEPLKLQWFAGAFLIAIGIILSTSTIEKKERSD